MKINTSHLVGAAIALAAVFFSKLDVQSTPAPVPAERQKWEYKSIGATEINSNAVELCNRAGYDGWELVSVAYDSKFNNFDVVFKRPRQ